jgi:hypothetical protein
MTRFSRWALFVVGAFTLAAIVATGVGRIRGIVDSEKERRFIARLYVGMSRAALYEQAREENIKLSNQHYIVWHDLADAPGTVARVQDKPGHVYVPIAGGQFPLPTRLNPHPPVELITVRRGGWLLWTYDRVDIDFDAHDRVGSWHFSSGVTGI